MGCMASCSNDGEAVPSVLTELCDVYIDRQGVASQAVLDDGTLMDIAAQGLKADVADTTVRCVITYAWADGAPHVYSSTPALCMQAVPASKFHALPHDPVRLVSVWQKGRYVNMVFGEMTTGNGPHEYAFCIDSLRGRTLYTSLLHRQPAADAASYTQKRYASMPIRGNGSEAYDSLVLCILTYDGLRAFAFPAAE